MKFKRNVLLKNYTTFKIGGRARYFFLAKTKKDLIKAIEVAKNLRLPFFILGGGSKLLVSDKGYWGLIIKIQNSKFKIENSKIVAEAGTKLAKLVNASVKAGLFGLEWAIGIPGTLGGAIYGNAGAFGHSMADIIESVEVLKITNTGPFQIEKFVNKDCKFDYRDSIFKRMNNSVFNLRLGGMKKQACKHPNLIILSAVLKLKKGNKKEIEKKIKEYLNYRKKTQPLDYPSAGSIFKNPPCFSAGELIERCGLKGKRIGNVKISEKHANFIINLGNGKAKEVKKLINFIKKKVKNKFKIKLEEEIQYLGLK